MKIRCPRFGVGSTLLRNQAGSHFRYVRPSLIKNTGSYLVSWNQPNKRQTNNLVGNNQETPLL